MQYRQKTKKPHGSRGFFALYLPVVPLSNVTTFWNSFSIAKKNKQVKRFILYIFLSLSQSR
nr:MAG TPA: hypothetical protein [Caudoviricetes sp.]